MNNKKESIYDRLFTQLETLFDENRSPISCMSTIAALLHHKLPDLLWTGFYLIENGALNVGPYQGPLACINLKKGEGVCWHSVLNNKTVIVPDVDKFPGHIACSPLSKSEIVVPIRDLNSNVVAVLDLDSRKYDRFSQSDQVGLEKIVSLIYI